jgi:SNW domain-containing protein 1
MDDGDDEDAAEAEMGKIQRSNRFEALGKGTFKGSADVEVSSSLRGVVINTNVMVQAREGPVQFEKDTGDVFNVDEFLSKVGETSNKREYGLQESDDRKAKRARVDEDED